VNEIVKLNSEIVKFAEIKQSEKEVQATVMMFSKDIQANPLVRTV
jgi:hypothetical protein